MITMATILIFIMMTISITMTILIMILMTIIFILPADHAPPCSVNTLIGAPPHLLLTKDKYKSFTRIKYKYKWKYKI